MMEAKTLKDLTVDILIITRNRPAALALSLPLILKQSVQPQQVIIVDSSDDKAPALGIVARASRTSATSIVLLHSKRGTALQRNVGLEKVTADVTLFLDDDSLLLDDAILNIMRVYQRDSEEVIGGVCSREADWVPDDIINGARKAYEMRAPDRWKLRVSSLRYKFEQKAFPDPLQLHGRSLLDVRPPPAWLAEENAVLVEHMTGFRMSFRTKLIRQFGFDEALSDYALGEDIDVSFSAARTHLLVGARNAGIFHYKDPGRRAPGLTMGVIQILNNAYIICKHSPPSSPARASMASFFGYKIALYALAAHSPYGRDRFVGAIRAYKGLPALMEAPPHDLASVYLALRDQCMAGAGGAGAAQGLEAPAPGRTGARIL
jgi:glycosyltransferase involved in cell wall biosynthesis